ncbi:hypothetical protein H0H81_010282 [Sphagnurus paluster]|uniref:Uncharacterized protein n=1 Tax=Sphagnurus paluster TaxID=117069 RepID=A0A9P7GNE6_9AGAR|nr:hypothetical protein H0H81_010282 [Sphagnurus paluster]
MVQYFDKIPEFLFPWIEKQKMFWVATAPLTPDGLVNISPKGMTGSFRVVNPNQVWYEDLTGSGTVYEFGTPEYEALLPPEKRKIGSRSIIMIDVFKVGTSCGYAVPFYTYKAERNRLLSFALDRERTDVEAEKSLDENCSAPPRPDKGLKRYWSSQNAHSQDGLPGILTGHDSLSRFSPPAESLKGDDESEGGRIGVGEVKLVAAFLTGVILTASYVKFIKPSS